MAKPKKIPFTEALESVLVAIWGVSRDHLDDSFIEKTREALIEIQAIYRFKGDYKKYPSKINYRLPRNRAGYLAAFGQRHAYLTYTHLRNVERINAEVVPQPENNGRELVITMLGAGAAIETYGVCLFYNAEAQRLRKLTLNLVEKVDAWKSDRHTVFEKVLKGTFPKLAVVPIDIDADLTEDCLANFVSRYETLSKTDILLIYNVVNEITVKHARMVWKNINFILKICDRPVLVLLMEPSARKALPRVDWLKTQLAQSSEVISEKDEEEFLFSSEPIRIDFENTNVGLNDRMFAERLGGGRPKLQRSLKRTQLAATVKPRTPISIEQVQKQLAMLNLKRGKGGRFIKRPTSQSTFFDIKPGWDKS